jgi:hypothetical protein
MTADWWSAVWVNYLLGRTHILGEGTESRHTEVGPNLVTDPE